MSEAGIIKSNLKPVTTSYDEELCISPEQQKLYDSLAKDGNSTKEMEELTEEQFEMAYFAAEPQRWKGQDRFMGAEMEAMRMVNILHPHAIIRKLQDAGVEARLDPPQVYVMEAAPTSGLLVATKRERAGERLWLHEDAIGGLVGVSGWIKDEKTGEHERRLITALQYPYGPEWSLFYFDEWDVPIKERFRGWRTAMLQLIKRGVLTEEEVDRAFGPVAINRASQIYREELQRLRSQPRGASQ